MPPGAPSAPDIPTPGESLQNVLNVLAQQLPEIQAIQRSDVLQNLALQAEIGPSQIVSQLGQQAQFGPAAAAIQSENQRQQALNQLFNVAQLSPGLRATQFAADPLTEATRQQLGGDVLTQLQSGLGLDPALRREAEQNIRSAQTARGISFGAAPVAAESLFVGQLAEQLRRQRQQAAENLIRLNVGTQPSAFQFAQGGGAAPLTGLQPQLQTGGQGQQFLQGLVGPTQQAALTQAQLDFNAAQLGQGGGIGGAAAGALGGAALGAAVPVIGPFLGAAIGGTAGFF